MFDPASRYFQVTTYSMKDHRGRTVTVVVSAPVPVQPLAGYHILKEGQHLDHLAFKYLDDGDAFWRIAEMNDVMQAEWLTEAREVAIPKKAG